jgi:multiple sugar transport system substrate-binding protein
MLAGGDAPDIIFLGNGDYPFFAERGALKPLDEYIKRDGLDLSDVFPGALALYEFQGKQWGFPVDFPNQELFYNVTMFQEAGLPEPSPDWEDDSWNWDALLTTAQKLTRDLDGDGRIDDWGFQVKTDFRGWWVWVAANGGEVFKKDGKGLALDQKPAIDALQFLGDMIHKHKVSPTVELANAMGGYEMFLGGNVGMATFWPAIGRLRDEIKDFEWNVVPHPQGAVGRAAAGGGTGHFISASTKHPEEAWTLMKFLVSEECVYLWTKIMGVVPPLQSVAESDVFLIPGAPPANILVFTEAAPYLRPDPRHTQFAQVSSILGEELDYLWLNRKTAAEAVQGAVVRVQRILK